MKASVHERTPVNGCSVCVCVMLLPRDQLDAIIKNSIRVRMCCSSVRRLSTVSVCVCVCRRGCIHVAVCRQRSPPASYLVYTGNPTQLQPAADHGSMRRLTGHCRTWTSFLHVQIDHTHWASPPNTRSQPGNRWPVCRAVTTDTSSHSVRLTDCLQQSALYSTERVVSIDGRTHGVCVYLTEKFTSPMNIAIHWLAKAALSRTNRTDGRTDRRISMTVGRY